jgi:hypothetical protein
MVATKLGCPYPRCPSGGEPRFKKVTGGIAECGSCGRLVVQCTERGCRHSGTYNRPFVRHCRRCKETDPERARLFEINQRAEWERARSDGWDLVPRSVSTPEVIADLSGLADSRSSGRVPIATAMVRGALAVHQPGHFLALLKVVPVADGDPFLWEMDRYPFPASSDGAHPPPYPPVLLPGDRHLMYSCPQGILVLDLWSCQGLSAKDNDPRCRLVRCQRRSLASAPIPLNASQIGLVTRDRTNEGHFRWSVWDLSKESRSDAEFSARLDSENDTDGVPMPWMARSCRADLVDDRIIAFSTPREQRVWRKEDAIALDVEKQKKTWLTDAAKLGESLILNQHPSDWASVGPARHAFLFEPGAERFSWFMCIRQDDPANPEPIKGYEVDFDTKRPPTRPQPIGLRSGAVPIGSAPNPNGILQMYFRAGTEIWFQNDGLGNNFYQGGLPQVLISLRLYGSLILSVGEKDQGERSIQIDSLRHRGEHADVFIENRLLSEPLLWYHWLFTIERDAEDRLQAYRRIVTFS